MAEELKTLEEGYESLAAALKAKQEWQRKILDVVPLAEGEQLDAVIDRIKLLVEERQELERRRSGQRRHSWPVIESVPDGLRYAAELVRAQGTEGGDEHDELLRQAAIRLRDLSDVARVLLADRDRVEASRQAWAEEAMRLDAIIETQIGRFEAQALKADAKIGEHPDALTAEACWRNAARWLKKAVAVSVSPEETP